MKPEIFDAADIEPTTRKSPVTLMLEAIGDEYKTVSDVAEMFDVHRQTVYRLIKAKNPDGTPKLKAPSKATKRGGLVVYLFTEEDLDELAVYFGRKRTKSGDKEDSN